MTPKKIRLCFRGWKTGASKCAFQERVSVSEDELETLLPKLAERHIEMLAKGGTVEIEFLDEPDEMKRFFRIGSDPSRMVRPIPIDLTEKGKN